MLRIKTGKDEAVFFPARSSRRSSSLESTANVDQGDDGFEAGDRGEHGPRRRCGLVRHRGEQQPGLEGLAEGGGGEGRADSVAHLCSTAQAPSGNLALPLSPSHQREPAQQPAAKLSDEQPVLQVLANVSETSREHEQSGQARSWQRLERSARPESGERDHREAENLRTAGEQDGEQDEEREVAHGGWRTT